MQVKLDVLLSERYIKHNNVDEMSRKGKQKQRRVHSLISQKD